MPQNFMYQLCIGIAHLHRHGVMHRREPRAGSTTTSANAPPPLRDLKPQNLLVDKARNILKIADLGLGRAFSVPVKSYTHEARHVCTQRRSDRAADGRRARRL
jgi:cyclin-dependent kinase